MFCSEGDVFWDSSWPKWQTAVFFICNCRQSDGDTLCELWRSYREQAKPYMCCPKGQRVKGSASGVYTLINMQDLCPGLFGLTWMCHLTHCVCSLNVQCTWPRCCRCPDSCGWTAEVGLLLLHIYNTEGQIHLSFCTAFPMHVTPGGFLYSRGAPAWKRILGALCMAAVGYVTILYAFEGCAGASKLKGKAQKNSMAAEKEC